MNHEPLLKLLQLASPALPVGAYSYSEGLETLVENGTIFNAESLEQWLLHSLQFGAIRLEAGVMIRAFKAIEIEDLDALKYWNAWATATKETEEIRQQSHQMGSALKRLLITLNPHLKTPFKVCENECNFAVAFGIAAQFWQIELQAALLGYLQSWAANLMGAGVKLIPLGQTAGQQLLLNLSENLIISAQEILQLTDDDLSGCTWGLSLASMQHESLYSRLFRS
jgi:urease accessory protein